MDQASDAIGASPGIGGVEGVPVIVPRYYLESLVRSVSEVVKHLSEGPRAPRLK
jgi:hypothetical protein